MCIKNLVSPLQASFGQGLGFNDMYAANIHETIVAHTHTCIFQYKYIHIHFESCNLIGQWQVSSFICTVTSLGIISA